ncbi:GTPase [Propioniciclava coleopterorum]|uniref:GTPase n=1 Tax=Propioniciclava coleopterorum TaxID=2714937 RepID=UPI001FE753B5|nr:GTPase [Propioniciclava coleopterorum]
MKAGKPPAPGLAARLTALDRAVELSRGRVPEEVLAPADALIDRAGRRLAIAGDHTVIALAGATGSGKSSLFNALSGTQFAKPGVTRPTTSEAMAVAWGRNCPARCWTGSRSGAATSSRPSPACRTDWCSSTCPTTTPPRPRTA